MLKPWLRSLNLWRHDTAVTPTKHGVKWFRSLGVGSDLRSVADMVPDDILLTEYGCDVQS